MRRLKKFETVEVTCREIVNEGMALVHVTGEAEPATGFVLGLLPGETGLVKTMKVYSGYFQGILLPREELSAEEKEQHFDHEKWALRNLSADRVPDGCDQFITCGGCKLLHLPYEKTLSAKTEWLAGRLKAEHISHPEIRRVESPSRHHYRNHVQVHINKHKERGFYGPFSYRTIPFPEHGCRIFPQRIFDRDFPQPLELERCVRARFSGDRTMITSLYSKEDKSSVFTYDIGFPAEGAVQVSLPNTAFFQVNSSILPLWLGEIAGFCRQAGEEKSPVKMLELFSGFGFISLMLSTVLNLESAGTDLLPAKEAAKAQLHSADPEKNDRLHSAQAAFARNYRQCDLTLAERVAGLKGWVESFSPEIIVMNPPRSGFKELPAFVERAMPAKIPFIYSSCHGASFARDAAYLLKSGYVLQDLVLFDFFPWTAHYETLGLFMPA